MVDIAGEGHLDIAVAGDFTGGYGLCTIGLMHGYLDRFKATGR